MVVEIVAVKLHILQKQFYNFIVFLLAMRLRAQDILFDIATVLVVELY